MGKTILTPTQHKFLELAAAEEKIVNRFYLAGGTALSEFYLQHRLSEDLDFFSEYPVDEKQIDKFIQLAATQIKAKLTKETHMGILVYHLILKNETLKVDFANNPFSQLEQGSHFQQLNIASLWDIVIDKFYTILHRSVARDFVDLYFGVRKVDCNTEQLISALNEKYEMNFGEISLTGHFLKVKDLEDFPQMLIPFNKKEMEQFYLQLTKELENKIFQ